MKPSFLMKCALIGAAVPLLAGCVERQVVYRDRPAAQVVTEEQIPPPPPPQVEVVPVIPGPAAVWFWAPGAWEWRGHWVWTEGRWIRRPHPGAVWVGPHWGSRGHHRVWVVGGWH